jgi:hypothetical protein
MPIRQSSVKEERETVRTFKMLIVGGIESDSPTAQKKFFRAVRLGAQLGNTTAAVFAPENQGWRLACPTLGVQPPGGPSAMQ